MADEQTVINTLTAALPPSGDYVTQAEMEEFNARQPEIIEKLNELRMLPGYLEILLHIIDTQDDYGLKYIAVTEMKNVIEHLWDNDQLFSNKDVIRSQILQLLLIDEAPQNFFNFIVESIGLIAASDFPSRWPQFNDFFGQINIDAESFTLVQRMLLAGSEVFKRFEDCSPKYDGGEKISLASAQWIEKLLAVITKLLPNYEISETYTAWGPALKLFDSLIASDLPPPFFDHLGEIFQVFTLLLQTDTVHETMDIKIKLLQVIQRCIFRYLHEIINYAEKKRRTGVEVTEAEEQAFLEIFADLLDKVLDQLSNDEKFEPQFSQFIVSVFKTINFIIKQLILREMYLNAERLEQMCKHVQQYLALDEEMIESMREDPLEYFNNDIGGYENESPRKSAYDLMKSLARYYKESIEEYFGYPNQVTKSDFDSCTLEMKDALIFFTGFFKAAKATRDGVIEVVEDFDLEQFISEIIIPIFTLEITPDQPELMILQADAVKFYVDYRNVVPAELTAENFKIFFQMLNSNIITTKLYGAYLIERICASKQLNVSSEFLMSQNISSIIPTLIQSLTYDGKTCAYIGKVLMRISSVGAEALTTVAASVIKTIITTIHSSIDNPTDTEFFHNLWETVAALLIYSHPPMEEVEEPLFDLIRTIIAKQSTDFIPYSIQIVGAMVNAHREGEPFTPVYAEFFGSMMSEEQWLPFGNIPALAMMITAYCKKLKELVLAAYEGIVNKCDELLQKSRTHMSAFVTLQAIISMNEPVIDVTGIIGIAWKNYPLQLPRYKSAFAIFMCSCINSIGADRFISSIPNDCRTEIFNELEKCLPLMRERKDIERVISGVMQALQSECVNINEWGNLMRGVIILLERPPHDDNINEELAAKKEEEAACTQFDTTFARLISAERHEQIDSDVNSTTNLNQYTANAVAAISAMRPGWLGEAVQKLSPLISDSFNKYQERFEVTFTY